MSSPILLASTLARQQVSNRKVNEGKLFQSGDRHASAMRAVPTPAKSGAHATVRTPQKLQARPSKPLPEQHTQACPTSRPLKGRGCEHSSLMRTTPLPSPLTRPVTQGSPLKKTGVPSEISTASSTPQGSPLTKPVPKGTPLTNAGLSDRLASHLDRLQQEAASCKVDPLRWTRPQVTSPQHSVQDAWHNACPLLELPAASSVEDLATMPVVEEVPVFMAHATTMTTEELTLESDVFDPTDPELKLQLFDRLGLPETTTIKKLAGDQGAFNDGIWEVSNSNASGVILKLVPHERAHAAARPTDSEQYKKLQGVCPNIVTEFALSFPLKIFELRSPCGTKCQDLLVLRRATGLQLTEHIFLKFHGGSVPALLKIFNKFGAFMSTIHRVYKGMQHGDCQPSNIFYDECSGLFTLIDVADFGLGPYMAEGGGNDVEQFVVGLWTLSQWYGRDLISDCEKQFRRGYEEEKQARMAA